MLSKNVNKQKCNPKLVFFNKKKIEKDSDDFWLLMIFNFISLDLKLHNQYCQYLDYNFPE